MFSASGLASGMDWSSIIDSMVQIESQPLTLLANKKSALNAQISKLGDLSSKLSDLESAAGALKTGGVLGLTATTSSTSFSATAGSGATAGRYSVEVNQLAQAAKARSQGFASGSAGVTGGSLTLSVQGKAYDPITLTDGESLADVAYSINQLGAPVSAVVVNDGTNSYLSLNNRDTGYPLTGAAADALKWTESYTGSQGQALGLASVQGAQNAVVTVDKLKFTRQSNTISDALPGVTLNLTAQTPGTTDDLVLNNDATATQANLQKFVTAYNTVMGVLQSNLDASDVTDRERNLTGDSSVRMLQMQLQSLTSTPVAGLVGVRTLADLGIKTQKDGSLTIDTTTLQSALSINPGAANAIFADPVNGMAKKFSDLVDSYVAPGSGILTLDSQAKTDQVSSIDSQTTQMQVRIDAYRQTLQDQFTAMESIISGLKATSSFLTQQSNQSSSK
ncbi:flagellar filament capping protein FliD [Anaeromyxobacter paludicola]|uniref:flagellar filament capping protein FliD n=1 Tax=Anaeromyxobacter paludicola TaxID=2918171 RepID=UPI00209B1B6A|nr:flagellar filament capping protein FliD [Anaeromyxobacter paludicola]